MELTTLHKIDTNERINFSALLLIFSFPLLKFIISFFTEVNLLAFNIVYFFSVLLYLLPKCVLWFINCKNKKEQFIALKYRPELILLLLFLFWITFATFFSPNFSVAFLGIEDGKMFEEGLIQFFTYAAVFIFAYNLKTDKLKHLILKILIIISVICALFSYIDPFGEIFPAFYNTYPYSSVFVNSNHYGYFLCLTIMTSIGFSLFEKNIYQKIAFIVASIFLVVQLLLNGSFGPALAVFAALIVLPFAYKIFKGKWSIFTVIPIATFLLLAGIINNHKFFSDLFLTIGQIFGIIRNESNVGSYGTGRIELWLHSLHIIAQNPIFGVGFGNFTMNGYTSRPHNEYLQYMVNTGILGGLFYIAALITIFVRAIQKRRETSDLSFILGGAIFCYLISAFFGNTMPHVMPFFTALLAMFIKTINPITKNKVA